MLWTDLRFVGALVVVCSAISACGSTSSGSPPPSSGVSAPPSTPVSQLSPADTTTLCQFYVDRSSPASDVCTYLAVATTSGGQGTAAELKAACEQAEQQCVTGYSALSTTVQTQCEQGWFADSCNATVAEVESCIRDISAEYDRLYTSVGTCSSDLSAPFQAPKGTLSSGCVATLRKCPTLFGGTTDSTPPPSTNPTVASCETACSAYTTACSVAECPDSCDIQVSVYGQACEALGKKFYDCAATSTFTCSQTDWPTAADDCKAEYADYLTCFGLGGVTCVRAASMDASCAQSTPASPYGKQCVAEAAPADCTVYTGSIYCCATQ